MSSFEPGECADEVEAREEIARGLLVAGGDGPEMLDGIEKALDEIALGIKREVAVAFDLAVGFRRDDRLDGAHFEAVDEAVAVIAPRVKPEGRLLSARSACGSIWAVSASAWVMSWTWPPVRLSANGFPKASTMAWIFVVRPPRERPMA